MSTTASPPLFHDQPDTHRVIVSAVEKALLVAGILSSLTYVAANIVGSIAWPAYSTTSQTISELSAIDAPSRPLWLAFMIPYELFSLAFAIGVWRVARGHRALRVSAALLIAMTVLGAFWPPMHQRGEVTTLTDTLHVVFAGATSLLILLAILFGAGASGWGFRRYSITTIAMLLVFGVMTAIYAPSVAANLATPWLGVIERVMLGSYLLWIAVLAVVLLRPPRATQPNRIE